MGGPLIQQIQNQFDDTPGGGAWDRGGAFTPGESTYEGNEMTDGDGEGVEEASSAFLKQFDQTEGGGFADKTADAAKNLGPDWLDEVTLIGIPIVLVLAVLFLLRPYIGLLDGVSG